MPVVATIVELSVERDSAQRMPSFSALPTHLLIKLSFFKYKRYFCCMYMSILPTFLCTMCMPDACGGQKSHSLQLELELWAIMWVLGIHIWVLCKSSQCSQPLCHLFSPIYLFFLWNRVLLCNDLGCTGAYCIVQAGLQLLRSPLSLPPECWR